MTGQRVLLEMSMSLDGFVARPDVSVNQPMGDDRDRIHDWMFKGKTDREAEAWEEERFADVGAVIMGNTTFEVGVGPWGRQSNLPRAMFRRFPPGTADDRQGWWNALRLRSRRDRECSREGASRRWHDGRHGDGRSEHR
jgi:dihydrofolate reductase